MKSKSISILSVAIGLLGIIAVMLIVFVEQAHDDFEKGITVSAEGVTTETLEVRDLTLNPTETREYEVNLTCPASGSFDISLVFEEVIDGGMKQFVDVTVSLGDTEVYRGRLSELIASGTAVSFEGELLAEEPLVLSVSYTMPRDVGNEAQGTYAEFDVHLTVEKS